MSSNAAPGAPPRAGLRQWFGLAMLLLPTMLMTVDLGVLWLATPHLVADLQPTSSQLLWITDSYGFMTAGFLIIMGTLGDRIGRRKLLMIGSVMFIVASLITAYAQSAEVLIAGRALLGIAGAAVLPSTLALISHMFVNPRQRGTAIAMWVTALSIGLGIGPIIGGFMLAGWWWGSVFLLAVPVMLLALVTSPILLPEYRDPNAGRLDLLSVVLFLASILPVVYAIKRLAEYGFGFQVVLTAVLGIAFGVAFVFRQRALADPLIDLKLFSNRTFTAALGVLVFGMMALNGVEYVIPQFLQLIGGTTPLAAALWLAPGAAGLLIGSQLTPILTRFVRPAYVIAGGQFISLIGFAMIFMSGEGQSGVVLSALGLTVIMFCVAPISVLGTVIAVGSAPPEKAGVAAGTGQTSYDMGLALGIAVVGSVSVAVYRSDVAATVPPDLPPDVAAGVNDTLGGAVSAVQQLPPSLADNVLASAREAFINGFHTSALVSAIIAVLLGVMVLVMLRHIPPTPKESDDAEPEPAEAHAEDVLVEQRNSS
jgi:MFS transporter, DHA2 family, multidrug resistance protein